MQGQGIQTITVRELHQLSQQRPVDLIDVRTPEEFREVRATIARSMPMDAIDLESLTQSRVGNEDDPLYFICHLGGRSGRVCAALMAAGLSERGQCRRRHGSMGRGGIAVEHG